jgi:hypothetical protein
VKVGRGVLDVEEVLDDDDEDEDSSSAWAAAAYSAAAAITERRIAKLVIQLIRRGKGIGRRGVAIPKECGWKRSRKRIRWQEGGGEQLKMSSR